MLCKIQDLVVKITRAKCRDVVMTLLMLQQGRALPALHDPTVGAVNDNGNRCVVHPAVCSGGVTGAKAERLSPN